jgi:hypothetical protein
MSGTLPVDNIRALMAVALAGLLLLLRLDAYRFGAAEYDTDEPGEAGAPASGRLAWPALAIVLVAGVALLLPAGPSAVGFGGDRISVILWTVIGAAVGVGAVLGVAYLKEPTWPPRLQETDRVPRLALDALGTAIVDELTFRGVLLGLLLLAGIPAPAAFAIQLLAYGLGTRLGRSRATFGLLLEAVGLGALMGIVVLASGSVVAALLAHAAIRFAALDVEGGLPPVLPRRFA